MFIHFRMSVAFIYRNRNYMKSHCNSQQTALNGSLSDQISLLKSTFYSKQENCSVNVVDPVSYWSSAIYCVCSYWRPECTGCPEESRIEDLSSGQAYVSIVLPVYSVPYFPLYYTTNISHLLNFAVPLFTFIYSKFSRWTEEFS